MNITESLRPLFEPDSIVIIGATKRVGFGYGIPSYLIRHGFGDRLYLVNPHEKEMWGHKVFKSVNELPITPDLAIIIVPAKGVPKTLKDCQGMGVRLAVVESAGFSEAGNEGALLEKEIREITKEGEMRILGPNCIGALNVENRMSCFQLLIDRIRPGGISIVAQSGVFGNILMDCAIDQPVGFSKVITIGNKVDLNELDFLRYLHADPGTRVIGLYLEGVRDGDPFLKVLKEVTGGKPVVVLKSGRTPEGNKAAASHTGSLAGHDGIFDGVFSQTGAIRVYSIAEMCDVLYAFSLLPPPSGRQMGVVTCSGSMGVLVTDKLVRSGFETPTPSNQTIEWMGSRAPSWMNIKNPLDVGPSGLFSMAVEAMMRDDRIDGIIGIPIIPYAIIDKYSATPQFVRNIFGDPEKFQSLASHKPLVLTSMGSAVWMDMIKDIYGNRIPIVSSPENAVSCMNAMYRYGRYRKLINKRSLAV